MAGVYLAELDAPEVRRAADEATVEHGAAAAAKRRLELRLPLFERVGFVNSVVADLQGNRVGAGEA